MKLQISKLFLVRRGTHEIKSYDFDTGRLNIIIGQGARGKTTIWSIIDYVCCSRECKIDSEIVKAVEWVGLVLDTSAGKYAIAREVLEELNQASNNFFKRHLEIENDDLDPTEFSANANAAVIKGILDRATGVEAMTDYVDSQGASLSFSIRHLLCIVGQTYQVVSDQEQLFAYRAPQTWQALQKYFPAIIGVDADNLTVLQARRQQLQRDLNKLQEEYKEAVRVSETWKQDLGKQLLEAKRLTMIAASVNIPNDTEKALDLIRSIISAAKKSPTATYNTEILGDLAKRVSELEMDKGEIEFKIDSIKCRLEELDAFEQRALSFRSEASKLKDRLEIGKWMELNWKEINPGFFNYPYSDGRIAAEVRQEINTLMTRLRQYEDTILSNKKVLDFKQVNKAEQKKLKKQLEDLTGKFSQIKAELDGLKEQDESIRTRINEYERVNTRANQLVGELRKTLQLIENLTDTGSLSVRIESLKAKVGVAEADVNLERARVDDRLKNDLANMTERTFDVAESVGIDDSFRFANLEFDLKNLDFKIIKPDGETYLKNRKSTANHIAFHIGTTVALQELCLKKPKSLLPDFVVYDQPTQGRSGSILSENAGEKCFINIVKVLAGSVAETEGGWQPILIDAWNDSTLAKLGNADYKLVANLDEIGGLVPNEWMQ